MSSNLTVKKFSYRYIKRLTKGKKRSRINSVKTSRHVYGFTESSLLGCKANSYETS